jgi:hypothetical protein
MTFINVQRVNDIFVIMYCSHIYMFLDYCRTLTHPLYFIWVCGHLLAVCLSNVGALTSRNPMGLHGL